MVIAYAINPIIRTFLGGIAGWAVGQMYGEHIIATATALGFLKGWNYYDGARAFWDLGCLLGFIGGFFKGGIR